jgi:hypothetical protein
VIGQRLLRTFDRELIQREGVYQFRKRPLGPVLAGALCSLVGIGFCVAGRTQGSSGWVFIGFGSLLAIFGVFSLTGAFVLALSKRLQISATLDLGRRELRQGRRQIAFDDISRFQVLPFHDRFVSLAAVIRGKESIPLFTARPSTRATLEELAGQFTACLKPFSTAPPASDAVQTPTLEPYVQRFTGIIVLTIGILWTAAGYVFFSGLYFTSAFEHSGPQLPVWWAGVFIIGLGLSRLLKGQKRSSRPPS